MNSPVWLRRFSKLTCFSTLFLIFVGSLVTSTNSGLSVPDWPLSYGMLFPPMVGGVFYEHGHRMVAGVIVLLTLTLSFWIQFSEKRKWLKKLGWAALLIVIAQGILGGLTVLFFLPTPISTAHAVLSQTFFIITIIIAYSLSCERAEREKRQTSPNTELLKLSIILSAFIYLQLIIAALMRHTASGLAIPDFPTMGGTWIPLFNNDMLSTINEWRLTQNLEPVVLGQILIHFIHRLMALFIVVLTFILFLKNKDGDKIVRKNILLIALFVIIQIVLGIATIWSEKEFITTSFHVVTGAAILGLALLLVLRLSPLSLSKEK